MNDYQMYTKSGYNFYDIASMLQKAIRRGKFEEAGFAAKELAYSYRTFLWKRLLIISAEDCYGIITKEIVGLKLADDICSKGSGEKGDIFISKAIVLLCLAKKNRDACYFSCNFFLPDDLVVEKPELMSEYDDFDINKCMLPENKVPDWVFDCHTLKGKMKGKTINDMIIEEQKNLYPLQLSLFDDAPWDNYLEWEHKRK